MDKQLEGLKAMYQVRQALEEAGPDNIGKAAAALRSVMSGDEVQIEALDVPPQVLNLLSVVAGNIQSIRGGFSGETDVINFADLPRVLATIANPGAIGEEIGPRLDILDRRINEGFGKVSLRFGSLFQMIEPRVRANLGIPQRG